MWLLFVAMRLETVRFTQRGTTPEIFMGDAPGFPVNNSNHHTQLLNNRPKPKASQAYTAGEGTSNVCCFQRPLDQVQCAWISPLLFSHANGLLKITWHIIRERSWRGEINLPLRSAILNSCAILATVYPCTNMRSPIKEMTVSTWWHYTTYTSGSPWWDLVGRHPLQ